MWLKTQVGSNSPRFVDNREDPETSYKTNSYPFAPRGVARRGLSVAASGSGRVPGGCEPLICVNRLTVTCNAMVTSIPRGGGYR